MKTTKHIRLKVLAFLAFAMTFTLPSQAQTSEMFYSNIDWQATVLLKKEAVGE